MNDDQMREFVENLDPDWRDHFLEIDDAYEFYKKYGPHTHRPLPRHADELPEADFYGDDGE